MIASINKINAAITPQIQIKDHMIIDRFCVSSLLAQLLAQLHQNYSQTILARSVSTVSPVAIIDCMFNNRSISSAQQLLQYFGILRKFSPKSSSHD